MTFEKNTRELVNEVADDLSSQGINPTVERIRAITQKGSATTISDQLRQWRKRQGALSCDEAPLPPFLIEANRAMLDQAKTAAMEQFSEERAGYSNEIEALRGAIEQSESLHGELMSEVASLRATLLERDARLRDLDADMIKLRAENESLVDAIRQSRKDLSTKDEMLSAKTTGFEESLRTAEDRLRSMERMMLLEIDKARSSMKDTLAYSERKSGEYNLDLERMQRRFSDEKVAMQLKCDGLNVEIGRLSGLLSVMQQSRLVRGKGNSMRRR